VQRWQTVMVQRASAETYLIRRHLTVLMRAARTPQTGCSSIPEPCSLESNVKQQDTSTLSVETYFFIEQKFQRDGYRSLHHSWYQAAALHVQKYSLKRPCHKYSAANR
jgi:hypothetical protein